MLITNPGFLSHFSLTSKDQENHPPCNTPPFPVKPTNIKEPLSSLKRNASSMFGHATTKKVVKTLENTHPLTQKNGLQKAISLRSRTLSSATNSSKRESGKKAGTSSKHPHVVRKIIKPSEDAFFITESEENKQEGKFNETNLKEHAFLRIQMFAVKSALLYGIGLRSDPSVLRDISVDIGRAYLQVGQSSNKGAAAHCNGEAGFTDGVRKVMMSEISKELNITPKKKHFLKIKGFTDEDFAFLEINRENAEKIHEKFDQVWPVDKKRPHSILSGTRIDTTLNSTTELPQSVNLSCDKGLEAVIRPLAIDLYKRLMASEITPQNACEEYRQNIVTYFEKMDILFEDRIAKIQKYEDKITKGFEEFDLLDAKEALARLCSMHKSLVAINEFEGEEKELSRTRIKENHNFLRSNIHSLGKDNNHLPFIKKWLVTNLDRLKLEVSDQVERFIKYRRFCKLEKEGSDLPDFTNLFGTYNEETATRELKTGDFETLQAKALKPKTPEKHRVLKGDVQAAAKDNVRQTLSFDEAPPL